VPFENNWFKFNSRKHFFNGKLHKHRYQLRVDATLTQGFNLHGAPPDSISVTNKKRITYWRLEDLRACTNEVNARLHNDLPFIVYGTAVNSDLYMHGHVVSTSLGGIPYMYSNIPYWVSILRLREAKAPAYRRLALKRIGIDAQTRKVRDWANGFGGVELHPVEKALRGHNRIARDFSFQWDDAWYDNEDMSLLKPGDLLFDKTLREIGRYNQYSKLLSTLRLRYETIYLHDKRAGFLSEYDLTNLWENELLFQLVNEGRRFYFHPKGRRGGYFVNELPFYWEGTSGLLADIDMLWSNNPKSPEFTLLGTSPPSSNTRHTQVNVYVDKDKNMEISAQILLKGQFSTMTRDAYLYGERDSTIMPDYGRRYLHDDSRVDLIDGPAEQHPYNTDISLSAVLSHRVKMSDEGSAELDLIDFFPFLIPAGFKAESRDIPFYWDFLQQDRYSVELSFDYDVQVEEQDLRYGSIDLGTQLHISVAQTSSSSFIVSAALLVTTERVPAGRANDLQEVFEAARMLESMDIEMPISD
jgi:hypothetical protein